jgi:hypothetical protein
MDDATCERKGDYLLGHIKSKTLIPIFLHPPDNDIHISRVLLNGGSWEKELLERMLRSMTQFPEAIFIDIGAHVGVYSLSIASHGHNVIAIDCYQGNVERLCASTKAAKLSNRISIIYNAISKTRGNGVRFRFYQVFSGIHVKFIFYQVFSAVHVKFKFYHVFSGIHVRFRFYQVFSGIHVRFRFYEVFIGIHVNLSYIRFLVGFM